MEYTALINSLIKTIPTDAIRAQIYDDWIQADRAYDGVPLDSPIRELVSYVAAQEGNCTPHFKQTFARDIFAVNSEYLAGRYLAVSGE